MRKSKQRRLIFFGSTGSLPIRKNVTWLFPQIIMPRTKYRLICIVRSQSLRIVFLLLNIKERVRKNIPSGLQDTQQRKARLSSTITITTEQWIFYFMMAVKNRRLSVPVKLLDGMWQTVRGIFSALFITENLLPPTDMKERWRSDEIFRYRRAYLVGK